MMSVETPSIKTRPQGRQGDKKDIPTVSPLLYDLKRLSLQQETLLIQGLFTKMSLGHFPGRVNPSVAHCCFKRRRRTSGYCHHGAWSNCTGTTTRLAGYFFSKHTHKKGGRYLMFWVLKGQLTDDLWRASCPSVLRIFLFSLWQQTLG